MKYVYSTKNPSVFILFHWCQRAQGGLTESDITHKHRLRVRQTSIWPWTEAAFCVTYGTAYLARRHHWIHQRNNHPQGQGMNTHSRHQLHPTSRHKQLKGTELDIPVWYCKRGLSTTDLYTGYTGDALWRRHRRHYKTPKFTARKWQCVGQGFVAAPSFTLWKNVGTGQKLGVDIEDK